MVLNAEHHAEDFPVALEFAPGEGCTQPDPEGGEKEDGEAQQAEHDQDGNGQETDSFVTPQQVEHNQAVERQHQDHRGKLGATDAVQEGEQVEPEQPAGLGGPEQRQGRQQEEEHAEGNRERAGGDHPERHTEAEHEHRTHPGHDLCLPRIKGGVLLFGRPVMRNRGHQQVKHPHREGAHQGMRDVYPHGQRSNGD